MKIINPLATLPLLGLFTLRNLGVARYSVEGLPTETIYAAKAKSDAAAVAELVPSANFLQKRALMKAATPFGGMVNRVERLSPCSYRTPRNISPRSTGARRRLRGRRKFEHTAELEASTNGDANVEEFYHIYTDPTPAPDFQSYPTQNAIKDSASATATSLLSATNSDVSVGTYPVTSHVYETVPTSLPSLAVWTYSYSYRRNAHHMLYTNAEFMDVVDHEYQITIVAETLDQGPEPTPAMTSQTHGFDTPAAACAVTMSSLTLLAPHPGFFVQFLYVAENNYAGVDSKIPATIGAETSPNMMSTVMTTATDGETATATATVTATGPAIFNKALTVSSRTTIFTVLNASPGTELRVTAIGDCPVAQLCGFNQAALPSFTLKYPGRIQVTVVIGAVAYTCSEVGQTPTLTTTVTSTVTVATQSDTTSTVSSYLTQGTPPCPTEGLNVMASVATNTNGAAAVPPPHSLGYGIDFTVIALINGDSLDFYPCGSRVCGEPSIHPSASSTNRTAAPLSNSPLQLFITDTGLLVTASYELVYLATFENPCPVRLSNASAAGVVSTIQDVKLHWMASDDGSLRCFRNGTEVVFYGCQEAGRLSLSAADSEFFFDTSTCDQTTLKIKKTRRPNTKEVKTGELSLPDGSNNGTDSGDYHDAGFLNGHNDHGTNAGGSQSVTDGTPSKSFSEINRYFNDILSGAINNNVASNDVNNVSNKVMNILDEDLNISDMSNDKSRDTIYNDTSIADETLTATDRLPHAVVNNSDVGTGQVSSHQESTFQSSSVILPRHVPGEPAEKYAESTPASIPVSMVMPSNGTSMAASILPPKSTQTLAPFSSDTSSPRGPESAPVLGGALPDGTQAAPGLSAGLSSVTEITLPSSSLAAPAKPAWTPVSGRFPRQPCQPVDFRVPASKSISPPCDSPVGNSILSLMAPRRWQRRRKFQMS